MAEQETEHLVLRTPFGRKVLSGLFAVPRQEKTDRLIFDRGLQNETERRLKWARLPHGMLVMRLRLSPDSTVRGSLRDLSNDICNVRGTPGWSTRNASGRCFSGA